MTVEWRFTMVKAIVGANWGDEGKGKITDMLAEESDIIVRFQGGSNAGHTIINDYGKFALHLLPLGFLGAISLAFSSLFAMASPSSPAIVDVTCECIFVSFILHHQVF